MVSHKFSSKPLQFYPLNQTGSHTFSLWKLKINTSFAGTGEWPTLIPGTVNTRKSRKKTSRNVRKLIFQCYRPQARQFYLFFLLFSFLVYFTKCLVLNVRVGRSHYQILQGAYSTEVFQCFVNLSSPKRLGQFCFCLYFYSRYAIPCNIYSGTLWQSTWVLCDSVQEHQ